MECFDKYKCQGIAFFFFFLCQISRYVSNEQPCLETTGLYKDLLIYVSLFLFHILCSHFIKFMFSNFSISSFFFLLDILSQPFIKHCREAFIYMLLPPPTWAPKSLQMVTAAMKFHGISQARILEWLASSFSRGSS